MEGRLDIFWFARFDGFRLGCRRSALGWPSTALNVRYRDRAICCWTAWLGRVPSLLVKDYVASTEGRLTPHFLPGYAPERNPDKAGLSTG
jgi:hypothetical protein